MFTLGTVVLDYRGYRVTAQSIIPGILEREQEQSVVYGSIDFGKTVVTQSKYLDLLQKAGNQLKILPHKVVNDKEEEVELCSSVECKGIIGNDGRYYILDLLRTFPPDVNFLKVEGMELSKEAQALGFPIEHKHKLSCLRQELIDAFVESRYMMFIKYAAVQLQQLGLKKQLEPPVTPALKEEKKENGEKEKESEMEEDEAKRIVESMTEGITCGEKKEVGGVVFLCVFFNPCVSSRALSNIIHPTHVKSSPRWRTAPNRLFRRQLRLWEVSRRLNLTSGW